MMSTMGDTWKKFCRRTALKGCVKCSHKREAKNMNIFVDVIQACPPSLSPSLSPPGNVHRVGLGTRGGGRRKRNSILRALGWEEGMAVCFFLLPPSSCSQDGAGEG